MLINKRKGVGLKHHNDSKAFIEYLNNMDNIYENLVRIFYEINLWPYTQGADFMSGNFSFGTVKLTKNIDPDKCSYSGYVIGFDVCRSFSISDGNGFGKNVMIFGADMSSYVHIDNKKKDISILGKGSLDEVDIILRWLQ